MGQSRYHLSMTKLLEPQTILQKRYKIIAPIGQGGMGAVYRAEDLVLSGRICAIKEIQLDESGDERLQAQLREQFRREAEVLARMDHPNLPKVSDYFSQGSREYLVMDFVPGHDLRDMIEQAHKDGTTVELSKALDWIDQLCDALIYLHEQTPPILHRDIKPSNIKVTPSGLIKLVDFGLVKLQTSDEARTITIVQGRGTAAYTPLEQYGGDDEAHTDVRSDLYGLGATVYHLLTGQVPPTARERFLTPDSLILPRTLNPHISPGMEAAILQAMALHPKDRMASVREFQKMFRETYVPPAIAPLMLSRKELLEVVRSNWGLWLILGWGLVAALLITP